MCTNDGRLSYNERMTTNDKEQTNIHRLPMRTLSASTWLTDITNQANVANRLGDAYGREAQVEVWSAPLDEWKTVAGKYVNLTFGDHYGTQWEEPDGSDTDSRPPALRLSGYDQGDRAPVPNRPRIIPPTPNASYQQTGKTPPATSALGVLIRFAGGRN